MLSYGILQKKRMPAFVRFQADSDKLADAEYFYACPTDDCSTVGDFWNTTSNTIESAVTAALASKSDQVFRVCDADMAYGLCDKDLLKGGIMHDDWNLGTRHTDPFSRVAYSVTCVAFHVTSSALSHVLRFGG